MTHPAAEIAVVETYFPTVDEIKRKWTQTNEDIYVAPHLATDPDGERIVKVNWYQAIGAAKTVSRLAGRTFYVASFDEELNVIRTSAQGADEATKFAAWTRNRYETVDAGNRRFTRIFSHGPDLFADLETALTSNNIAGLHNLGAPDEVSESPNSDFLNAYLYYGNNPVFRDWYGRCDAHAHYGALYAREHLGFRLAYYEKEAVERAFTEQNRQLLGANRELRSKIEAARAALQ